eukprot:TRINITY_DN99436_c0_g1_i1.p1 TRINITY_DN99436_c0_g1~~TRINITY_DN99436_c0_g1_i1.p1  ORF type:complete len:210 (+),score=54.17 TRINITY_DN99436_c0_g1_i1:63-632(+)
MASEEDEPLGLESMLEELVERNRHVSGMALVSREGSDDSEAEAAPLAVGLEVPSPETVEALNSAFYEGEEGALKLSGRHFAPTKRLEIGDFLAVRLDEVSEDAVQKQVRETDDAADFLSGPSGLEALAVAAQEAASAMNAGPSTAEVPGIWLCPTRSRVLVVAFDAGMDDGFALKVCVGVAEHLVAEGK